MLTTGQIREISDIQISEMFNFLSLYEFSQKEKNNRHFASWELRKTPTKISCKQIFVNKEEGVSILSDNKEVMRGKNLWDIKKQIIFMI
jgi:hypothetical protein